MALGIYWATALLGLFVAILFLDGMGLFSTKNHFPVDSRTVIVTGGSQGMGCGLAKVFAQKGANVVIVARNQKKLDDAVKYISSHAKNPTKQRFLSISADLTSSSENIRVIQEVTRWNNNSPPDIVWANAGSSHPTLFIDTEIETLRSQMDTNYFAATYLAHATLRSWLKPSASSPSPLPPRHLVLTSSVVSFAGIAGYSPYAPCKAAIRSLADTLANEINLYNGLSRSPGSRSPAAEVRLHCVFPGTILSPGFEAEEKIKHEVTKILEKDDPKQTEDEIAGRAVGRLERGDFLVTTQFLAGVMRVGMLGGSPRNGWGIVDLVLGWVVGLVWVFVRWDLDSKVWKFGREKGVALPA